MIKISYLFKILFFFIILIFNFNIYASEISKKKFLSLKNNEVNLRQGPSFKYPIKLIYKKKFLPVIITDSSDSWRQVRDYENNTGWIHISQLSKRKSGINIKKDSIVYKKSTIYSKPIVKLEVGRLVLIEKCKTKWCKIKSGGYTGWALRDSFWGKF